MLSLYTVPVSPAVSLLMCARSIGVLLALLIGRKHRMTELMLMLKKCRAACGYVIADWATASQTLQVGKLLQNSRRRASFMMAQS